MRDLIARLEAATGPDRELDAEIADAVEFDPTCLHSPAYTASIDAAMTLVPPDTGIWGVAKLGDQYTAHAGNPDHEGATPALALCIAALRARMEDGND